MRYSFDPQLEADVYLPRMGETYTVLVNGSPSLDFIDFVDTEQGMYRVILVGKDGNFIMNQDCDDVLRRMKYADDLEVLIRQDDATCE